MRQFDRYAVNAGVSFRSPSLGRTPVRGALRDLSLSGGRIAAPQPVPPNSWLSLEIEHPSLGLLQTSARVVRPADEGFGVHFLWTDRKSLQALRDFLSPLAGLSDAEREDSTLRKIWGTLLRNSPDSLVNTMISWCNSTFALEDEMAGKDGEDFYEGTSPAIQKVYEKIRLFAPTTLPVLLEGETGTGKEVFSRTVHRLSQSADGPFVPVNCGAIPPTLAESLLFGHEKGSFTGANARQKGHFEEAAGGTLFLDEIGDLPLPIQVKMLRVLQERAFSRVGSHEEIPLSCRIVAASNKDLKREVREGRFRQDLYYRLEGVAVTIPPLRERAEDILPLARFLARKISRRMGLIAKDFSPAAERLIASHPWTGNVRELLNAVHRAVVVSRHIEILPEDLGVGLPSDRPGGGTLRERRERHEREVLYACLSRNGGNVGKVADELGISRPSVYNLMRKYALDGV